jgi:hypothetical protein
MTRFGFRSDVIFEAHRTALAEALLAEEFFSRPEGTPGPPRIRVGDADAAGHPRQWRHIESPTEIAYQLRCVLANQVVFDVGDHTAWDRTVRDTHMLWDVLNEWAAWMAPHGFRLEYWGALTGGVGTHTETFLHPNGLDRKAFADTVVGACNERLGLEQSLADGGVIVDPVCVAPNYEARQVREFGAAKKGRRKTLWTFGPGPYRRLPLDRDEAYKQAGVVIPTRLPIAEWPPGALHATVAVTFGRCPRGPQCLPGPESTVGLDMTCEQCPTGR